MLVRLKIIVVLLPVSVAAFTSAFHFGKYKQRQEGAIQQLQRDIQTERERVKDDANTRNLPDYDFCIQSLLRCGVQSTDCEQLRGLAQK